MQAQTNIVDVNEQNIQDILTQSQQIPVLFDFWASWCEPCKQMAPVLERVIAEYPGKVLLAKVNADDQQRIASQFGVRSLPALKLVFQGQLVSELDGLQTEGALRQWIAPYVDPEAAQQAQQEGFIEQVKLAIEAGHGQQAEQALMQALQQDPQQHALRATLVEYLLSAGRQQDAQSMLAEIAEDVAELRPFRARFALLDRLSDEPVTLAELAERVAKAPQPDDLYRYGLQAAASGQFRAGLDALIVLLRDHGDYGDGAAKTALLDVFACLPKGDPLASEYRRKMFNYLY